VGRWTFGDTLPSPAIGGKDPVERIRRLLQKCPDELPPPAPELPFIDDDDLRSGIEDRIRAAWTDFKAQEWMGATVLAGAALEALLLWKLKQSEVKSDKSSAQRPQLRLDELHLSELIVKAEQQNSLASTRRAKHGLQRTQEIWSIPDARPDPAQSAARRRH
jgi:hypothetical protein